MRFETTKDRDRETVAIDAFTKKFGLTYKKLGEHDVDFSIHLDDKLISYVEVKGRNKESKYAYPLPVAIRKLVKLSDKRIEPVLIWACFDGIIYSKVRDLKGTVKYGGRAPRQGAVNDQELMAYFDKSDNFTFIPFE